MFARVLYLSLHGVLGTSLLGTARPALRLVKGKWGYSKQLLTLHALTKDHDPDVRLGREGFQRVQLPEPMRSVVPETLRRWQRDATDEDAKVSMVGQGGGDATERAKSEILAATQQTMSQPILTGNAEQAMFSWDDDDTLRLYLHADAPLIRQSSQLGDSTPGKAEILGSTNTPGQATAPYPHTDLTTPADEARIQALLAKHGRPPLLVSHFGVATASARALGVAPSFTDDQIASLVCAGTLDWTGMWMSPDHRAQPLAVCDQTTVDLTKSTIACFGVDASANVPDYTRQVAHIRPDGTAFKPGALAFIEYIARGSAWQALSDGMQYISGCFPSRKFAWNDAVGQIQYSYMDDPAHRWCFFEDLAGNEALVFEGTSRTFHSAFTPIPQTASVERVSAEIRPLCLKVTVNEDSSIRKGTAFLAAIVKDGVPVFSDAGKAEQFIRDIITRANQQKVRLRSRL